MDIFKRTAHAVLAADCAESKPHLRINRTEKRGRGYTPYLCFLRHSLEEFLQGQANVAIFCARRRDLRYRSNDGINRTDKRARFHQVRRITVRRNGAIVRFTAANFRCHRNRGRALGLTAPRHIYRSCADGRVEGFRQALLCANVQVRQDFFRFFREI